jgi:predicted N-acetyltransferase YhbS
MARVNRPVNRRLNADLVLRSVQDEADAARFVAFNATVNGDDQGATCTALLHHHPTASWDGFIMVEDETTGAIVSTTCLIPWRCELGGVGLDVAMLEMVVTHPDYRKRGLVRAQIAHFHEQAAALGYDLCIIEGIPYYYRQFGYAYAGDHWPVDGLAVAYVPDDPAARPVRLRRAAEADVPALARFHAATVDPLDLRTPRTADYWRYLLSAADYPVYMVEPADLTGAAALGYVVVWQWPSNKQVVIAIEHGIPDPTAALAVLRQLAPLGQEICVGWPAHSTLVQVARGLGSEFLRLHSDQWLVRVVDLPRLLTKLAPVFAERLAQAGWAGLRTDLVLNLFRQAYRLRIADGALVGVDRLGFVDASMRADGGDLGIPPDAFMRLLLGYRSLAELHDAWPDIVVRGARRHLLATLFPQLDAHIWLPYMHCGYLSAPLG